MKVIGCAQPPSCCEPASLFRALGGTQPAPASQHPSPDMNNCTTITAQHLLYTLLLSPGDINMSYVAITGWFSTPPGGI